MEAILLVLLVAILNGAIVFIDSMLENLVSITLYADQYMVTATGVNMADMLFDILFGFGISLIILKFLKKGFETYIMWTDGDPDTEPTGLVIRFVEAIVVAVTFPTLYSWMASITEGLIDQLLSGIGAATNYEWQAWVGGLSSLGLVNVIFGLIFIVCYFMLYFQFLMKGLEICKFRFIGLPFSL